MWLLKCRKCVETSVCIIAKVKKSFRWKDWQENMAKGGLKVNTAKPEVFVSSKVKTTEPTNIIIGEWYYIGTSTEI